MRRFFTNTRTAQRLGSACSRLSLEQLKVLQNTAWMLSAEGCARLSRLVAIIAMAAMLPIEQYGMAMLALALHEMIRLVTRIGASAKIVQCDESDLAETMGACFALNWIVAIALTVLQIALADTIASYYGEASIAPLLSMMAISYLLYPTVAIKAAFIQRNSGFKAIGLITAVSVSTDNLATALLLIMDYGIMSVAMAKIAAASVWVLGFALFVKRPKAYPRVNRSIKISSLKNLLRFSIPVFTAEVARSARNQVDVLLAGKLLAPEIFGIYTFAKSAGIGFGLALINAFIGAVYPKLASAARNQQLTESSTTLLWPIIGVCTLVILQASLAPIYVPLIFNGEFSNAGMVVGVLCLMAIAFLIIDLIGLMLRVQLKLKSEMLINVIAATCIAVILLASSESSAQIIANKVTLASYAAIPIAMAFCFATLNSSNPIKNLHR